MFRLSYLSNNWNEIDVVIYCKIIKKIVNCCSQHALQTQGSHFHLDELTNEEDFEPDYEHEQDSYDTDDEEDHDVQVHIVKCWDNLL